MGYLKNLDLSSFTRAGYLKHITSGLDREKFLATTPGRRALTFHDPLAFALLYLPHHLKSPDTGGDVTLSPFHIALYEEARGWDHVYEKHQRRSAWLAPRESGKSTMGFLLLPLWALAHKHRTFVLAFADSSTQATQHLISLKSELDKNELLRHDFPELCTPDVRPLGGQTVTDRQNQYISSGGQVFFARGADSKTLGVKVENKRPDLILLDDIEPDESNYSLGLKNKRLSTIRNSIFPMSLTAVVMFLGTTTMADSIMHDLVRQVTDKTPPTWPQEENITTHYYPAITTAPTGERTSLWPQRWSLSFLESIEHTDSYAKNYDNQPGGHEGGFWKREDFTQGTLETLTRRVIVIDPAVTERTTSDLTGVAVVAYSPVEDVCVVEHAEGVSLTGKRLYEHVIKLLAHHPTRVHAVVIETNQGGDLWKDTFAGLPVPLLTHHSTHGKPVRAAWVLDKYQDRPTRVLHAERFPELEGQMTGFPNVIHDDIMDAVMAGIEFFLRPKPTKHKAKAAKVMYT